MSTTLENCSRWLSLWPNKVDEKDERLRGKQYLVCQEWFEYNNHSYFIKWLENIDKN